MKTYEAVAHHGVTAEVGGELAREPRVVLHAEVGRRWGAHVSLHDEIVAAAARAFS
jgi:hypothetical protein